MNNTKQNITKEIAPAVGIGILLVIVVALGAFFYQMMVTQGSFATTQTIIDVNAQREESRDISPQERLVEIEAELEELTADVSGDDLFGLEQLDAELVEFADLDALFDFEL